jgi:hypothetical protein
LLAAANMRTTVNETIKEKPEIKLPPQVHEKEIEQFILLLPNL